jgi:Spy/CpxP family protein refolding chaperone
MKMKWVLMVTMCVAGAGLVAWGAGIESGNGWVRQRAAGLMIRGVEQELGISEGQRAEIKGILKTEQPAIEALAARVRGDQEQLQSQRTFDEAYVRAFAKAHEATMEDVLVEQQKVRAEIRAVLTPEQRAKADEMRMFFYTRFTDRLARLGDQL